MDVLHLVRAARRLGLKARSVESSTARLSRLPLPAVAEMRDAGFMVLARVAEERVLVQEGSRPPRLLGVEEFEARWTGRLVLLTRRAALAGAERRFDLTWFIPPVVKYRRLFGEVLLVSFFLQLFALVTPLFFQVVIDKVLVHRGLTTLDVLVVGLVGVTVFEIVLGGLRTYVLSHTTSRVDVELGAGLFRHLLGLPLAYFESRPVGQTVARVHELETIRNFLTGSAVTLVLDLLFTVVFLAVMYWYSPTLTYVVLGSIPFYVLISVGDHAGAAPPGGGEVPARRGQPGVSGRGDHRRGDAEVDVGGAADAPALGGAARGLRAGVVPGGGARDGRQPVGAVGGQAGDGAHAVARCASGDRRRAHGRPAHRVQHAGRTGERADPAACAVVAGLPGGAYLGRAARGRAQHAGGAGALPPGARRCPRCRDGYGSSG